MRKINYDIEIDRIVKFMRKTLAGSGLKKFVIGLSGGIDSALSAALAVKAVGSENVVGVMLPYKASSPDSYNDAKTVAETFNIQYTKVEITPMVDPYFDQYETDNASALRKGNFMARMRMIVLYDYSAKHGGLVVGTGNISELLTGYCTQYGDSACAFEPIGHLYKTEVWEMSRILGVPAIVIDKKPTADLWDAQTDEQEMGISYPILDEVLYRKFEIKLEDSQIITDEITANHLKIAMNLYNKSKFKRVMPPTLEEIE